ncbi:MAG: thiamine phosphate synthase [Candidatus Azobacteroides pseudotrichonymphae]|jgi:thiamine-phosphate pyrophosphorylase|uniref:Thiamine-phosphate synthase n=1 Tax=Azobacteroides pseudotrichonymphae genomovar. CFP2 TaxID=511995 RepID=B6YS05_AZOPC|nr:thiamine phosphate synthase [Candidatus Azobacteroides pseudotrichonymphae]MDR0530405.1 thiamine phosphate synthase [Bacteroidales bacterium OttesenSCG-928-I14]BAG83977.1 thiamine-phosphate pyrophosphorylase [Candidatus Azobacteroides pseudotrichonymphae genomovar. CFP2]GMO33876.1 MAG: thiamine phosphate synthase [Candidatus Azobacteroides pseudotrichonymphae]
MKKKIPQGLYAITAENFSKKNNVEIVKELLDSGIRIIQYREKKKTKFEKLKQCETIRQLTLSYNCFFIVNDDIDIAMSVHSDGIHLGQDDLPLLKARIIVGQDMAIGISTHNPEQANKATINGADYIGVGPIFQTFTKENMIDAVGLEYLEYCVIHIKIPKVAIGGIKLSNLSRVAKFKPENICMVTEIVGSKNIVETINKAKKIINDYY